MPDSSREAQSRSQQQSGAEGVGLVDGKHVGIGPTRTSLAWIGEVFETIEARARWDVLIREFPGDQVVLSEAMVDPDIELLVGTVAWTRAEPVIEISSAGDIGLVEISSSSFAPPDQSDCRERWLAGPGWYKVARLLKGINVLRSDAAGIGVENSGVRVPDLAGSRAAMSIAIECPSLCAHNSPKSPARMAALGTPALAVLKPV